LWWWWAVAAVARSRPNRPTECAASRSSGGSPRRLRRPDSRRALGHIPSLDRPDPAVVPSARRRARGVAARIVPIGAELLERSFDFALVAPLEPNAEDAIDERRVGCELSPVIEGVLLETEASATIRGRAAKGGEVIPRLSVDGVHGVRTGEPHESAMLVASAASSSRAELRAQVGGDPRALEEGAVDVARGGVTR
jgi:hypothetical protein